MLERQQMKERLLENPIRPVSIGAVDGFDFILINSPVLKELCVEAVDNFRKERPRRGVLNILDEGENWLALHGDLEGGVDEPACEYNFHHITSWENIVSAFKLVVENERHVKGNKAIKIKPSFTICIEYHAKHGGHGKTVSNTDPNDFVQYVVAPARDSYQRIIPRTFKLSKYMEEGELYLGYISTELLKIMEYNADASTTKYIGITGITFWVARIKNTGARLAGYEELINNQLIYSCVNDTYTCALECLYIALHEDEYKSLKGNKKSISARVKRQYEDLFEEPFPQDFEGVEIMDTLNKASKKYNIKFVIYNYNMDIARLSPSDTGRYEQFTTIGEGEKSAELLLVSTIVVFHVIYIKFVDKLTKLNICPK
jgi:hypothetical protein